MSPINSQLRETGDEPGRSAGETSVDFGQGRFGRSGNHFTFRHRRYPHHLFALGYGGNGMTFGHLAARMLLERWQGVKSPDHDLFTFGR